MLLDIYTHKQCNPQYPLICMDEKSKQLLADSRQLIKARPGKIEKYDYEYVRKGTCNIFVAVAPWKGIRVTKVTDSRKKEDFARFIRDLVYIHFPDAICIQLALDNLNTHFKESLIETFGKRKANCILKRLKFIYTPKHGSWLNIAEIEINVMDRQRTGGRINSKEELEMNVAHWSQKRNDQAYTIDW